MYFLKLSATLKFIKPKKIEGTQETHEVTHTAEKPFPMQDVEKNQDIFEQHIIRSYKDEVALPRKAVLSLPEVYDEDMNQRDKTSEIQGKISVTDTAKKETKLSKHKLVPKTQETTAAIEEKVWEKSTLPDKPLKEKTEEIMVIPERKEDSLHETNIAIEKQRQMALKAESKERQGRKGDIVKTEDGNEDRGSVVAKVMIDEPKAPVTISRDARKQSREERRVLTEKSVKCDEHITLIRPKERDRRVEVTETIYEAEKAPVQNRFDVAAPSQMKKVTEDMNRIVETQIQPTNITVSSRETLQDLLLVKPEAAQELKSDVTFKEKVVSKVGGSLEEKLIDIELKRPKGIQQDSTAFSTKAEGAPRKGEKSRSRPPKEESLEKVAETKSLVPSKAVEKKRPSPQTAARGIKRLTILFILTRIHILFFEPTEGTLGHLSCSKSR